MSTEIMAKAGRFFGAIGLKLKEHSPEILLVAGIGGTIAGTVMACKATTKAGAIIEESKKTVEIVHQGMEDGMIEGQTYTIEDGKRDLTIVYTQTGVKLIKLYAPAIITGVLSIGSIVAGHTILKKRNLALAAAYTLVDQGFKNYRKNVVERFGKELDQELRYNIKAVECSEEVVNEKGKTEIKKEIVDEIDSNYVRKYSEFAKFFDETCYGYLDDAEYNKRFLLKQQNWANEKLRSQGYLFLNDVYTSLGMQKTPDGQVVGWIYDPKNPEHIGDNYVDFNIFNDQNGNDRRRRFVNGHEKSILLDFNVDGVIYNRAEIYK